MTEERLAFSLATILDSDHAARPLTTCPQGHLVVAGRSHWQPEAFTADLRKLTCVHIPDCDSGKGTT